jgi:hypothetical protein
VWLRIRTWWWSLLCSFSFHKVRGLSWQAEESLRSQELCYMHPYRKPTNASNDHFIVMFSQISAYQRHHQGAHMILTSYLHVGVHYEKNNGVSNNIASVTVVTLWKWVVMANCCWKRVHAWLHLPTSNHTARIVIHTLPQYRSCLSSFQGTTNPPDDGNYLPKHVGKNLKNGSINPNTISTHLLVFYIDTRVMCTQVTYYKT